MPGHLPLSRRWKASLRAKQWLSKESLLASLAGHQIPEKVSRPHYDVDRILKIVTAVLAVGAVILGAIAGACKENPRAVSAAVMLGIGTLAFQIAMFAFGVIMTILSYCIGIVTDFWNWCRLLAA
ncbi:Inner membrane protein yidI [Serratia fonticola]|uniref:Inner membrane protein yidI n=1 Tax=Serratia fonticola TaxID=47917 RepID=A0A4U9V4U4_SERFO|nr:Inner membrane protein yidI [Serratia fonticola]